LEEELFEDLLLTLSRLFLEESLRNAEEPLYSKEGTAVEPSVGILEETLLEEVLLT
jgi:hypothetical protein